MQSLFALCRPSCSSLRPEKAGVYRKVYDIVSGVQAEVSKVVEDRCRRPQKKFAALVESAAKTRRPV